MFLILKKFLRELNASAAAESAASGEKHN